MKYFLLSVYLAGDFSVRGAINLWGGIDRERMFGKGCQRPLCFGIIW